MEAQPGFYRGLIELPPDPILIRELKLLERHPSNLGKEAVTDPRGMHDDRANVVVGVIRTLSNHLGFLNDWSLWVDRNGLDPSPEDAKIAREKEAHVWQS